MLQRPAEDRVCLLVLATADDYNTPVLNTIDLWQGEWKICSKEDIILVQGKQASSSKMHGAEQNILSSNLNDHISANTLTSQCIMISYRNIESHKLMNHGMNETLINYIIALWILQYKANGQILDILEAFIRICHPQFLDSIYFESADVLLKDIKLMTWKYKVNLVKIFLVERFSAYYIVAGRSTGHNKHVQAKFCWLVKNFNQSWWIQHNTDKNGTCDFKLNSLTSLPC